jgi:sec-independent protein translocase protein TatC
MAEEDKLTQTMNELMESPGGQIILEIKQFFISRIKYLIGIFLFGIVIGFPITKAVITWLIDPSRLPSDVNIIVISPVEFILLQFQIATSIGAFLVTIYLIIEASWNGLKSPAVQQRIAELNLKPPSVGPTVILTIFSVFGLAVCGLFYSWEFLIPMILEYLTEDAQSAGISTEWRLSGYVGFIVSLALASAIGFQSPVVTLLVLRMGVVERYQIRNYRRHIWFTSFLIGALLSPPDPLSLFLVALPVVIFFELALIADSFTRRV